MKTLFFLFAFTAAFAQPGVDFLKLDASVKPDFEARAVAGHCAFTFNVSGRPDTIRIDAVSMTFGNLKINGKTVKFKAGAKYLALFEGYRKGKNTVEFDYAAQPRQTMYFTGSGNGRQIWTQGQGKFTSHWLPSFDDVNEKLVFNLTVSAPRGMEAISNGVLKNKTGDSENVWWRYQMDKPMSSYLAMIAIGHFEKHEETAASGVPLANYIAAEDAMDYRPTYRYAKKVFDFLENEIGVPYPWGVYKQAPVKDFLYGGMENTSATLFARDYVTDSVGFFDRNYVNVDAHELAHQWFGDLVTAKSGKHHWLQEGFATYYALLAEREVFGDDYFYSKLYDNAEDLQQAAKNDTVPILSEKASSLSYYQKGAWALHALREGVGEENFRKAVRNYLADYGFKNVETDDFLGEIGKVSGYDVAGFKKRWLESGRFPVEEALALLKKNAAIRQLLEIGQWREKPFAEKKADMERILKSDAYYTAKEEIAYQLQDVAFDEKLPLLMLALQTGERHVRQAVARTTLKFPESFEPEYEKLLDDQSYITREIAMAVLWRQFPALHARLLDKMDGQTGLQDKNLRIQWLTFALMEKGYRPTEKVNFYDELIGYASPGFDADVRQNALENLIYIGPNDKNAMKLLVNPLVHHKWQFVKFAREKIRELLKFVAPRKFYENLLPELPDNEKAALKKLLDEPQPGTITPIQEKK
jgi:aminopeptidase N